MKRRIFIDSSAWISYLSKHDVNRKEISGKIKVEVKNGAELYTSNDVVDEMVLRLVYDLGWGAAKKFIDFIKKGMYRKDIVQLWTDEEVRDEAFSVLEKFKEHKLSLTDATSMVLVKRFKIDCVLTLDSHFIKAGVKVC